MTTETENQNESTTEDLNAPKPAEKKLLDELKKAQAALKQFEALKHVDVAEYEALRAEKTQREEQDQIAKGKYDELVASKAAAHAKELEAVASRIQKRDAKLISASVAAAVAAEEGNTKLLSHLINPRVRVNDEGELEVLGEDGQVQDGMTVSDLVKELKKDADLAVAFKSAAITGTGSTSQKPTLTTAMANPYSKEHWNMTTQALMERTNKNLAAQMKAAAGRK